MEKSHKLTDFQIVGFLALIQELGVPIRLGFSPNEGRLWEVCPFDCNIRLCYTAGILEIKDPKHISLGTLVHELAHLVAEPAMCACFSREIQWLWWEVAVAYGVWGDTGLYLWQKDSGNYVLWNGVDTIFHVPWKTLKRYAKKAIRYGYSKGMLSQEGYPIALARHL